MRIRLDECVPARFRRELPGYEIQTVPQAGWASISNGKLLGLVAASGKFDVFLTVDKNLPNRNKTKTLPFAIVVLRSSCARSRTAFRPSGRLPQKYCAACRNFNQARFSF